MGGWSTEIPFDNRYHKQRTLFLWLFLKSLGRGEGATEATLGLEGVGEDSVTATKMQMPEVIGPVVCVAGAEEHSAQRSSGSRRDSLLTLKLLFGSTQRQTDVLV